MLSTPVISLLFLVCLLTPIFHVSSFKEGQNFCHSENVDSSLHLSTRTPYRVILDQNKNAPKPKPNCDVKHVWMAIRHGTRNPSSFIIQMMHDILPNLKDELIRMNKNGKGSLCKTEVESLTSWTPKVNVSDEKLLVSEGEFELENLGARVLNLFPELFQAQEENVDTAFKFRYTDSQRTYKSAVQFAQGLFGSPENVTFSKANEKHDPLLRFYKHCADWTKNIDDKPEKGMREKNAFKNSTTYAEVQRRVAAKVGLNNISNMDLEIIYQTCAFETAWNDSISSPWCALFSKEDLEVLEYSSDLKYYWNDGYGFPVNHQQACPLMQDMLAHFQNASAKSNQLKGVFYFTHSGALLKLLAHLGLYKDKEPLQHHNFEVHKSSRLWRVGKIDSFASNLAAILYSCNSTEEVMLLHQEQPVKLEGCTSSSGHPLLCPLDQLVQMFPTCPFEQICSLQPTKGPKIDL